MRKQHGHSPTLVRRNLRLFGRTNNLGKNERAEELHVWRVCGYLPIVFGGLGEGAKADAHQSHPRVLPSLFELDSFGLHFRDEHHRYALEPSKCIVLVPSTHCSFLGA